MLNTTVAEGPEGRVIAMDSITQATPGDAGAYVVSGSHGGLAPGARLKSALSSLIAR